MSAPKEARTHEQCSGARRALGQAPPGLCGLLGTGDPAAPRAALDAAHAIAGARLLDAGCGAGLLAVLASLRGAHVTGIDASPGLIGIAQERLPAADLREGDLESLPFPEASFDAVTAVNSIFYTADMAKAMRELARVVRPGGR
ncbi:MAG: class I SAM-dependent methyltransferase, partial [Bryobacteraceae bacterium]|nr:class I SAM-dependent methyltransferase [Bryobacteraceae bacterium]